MHYKMENIKLDNGLYLNRDFGRMCPNMNFISNKEIKGDVFGWDNDYRVDEKYPEMTKLNWDGSIGIIEGEFRINKKGNKIFDLTKQTHLLVEVYWGGSFSKTRGMGDIKKDTKGVIHCHAAKSNGGGQGHTYWVLEKDFKPDYSDFI